MLYSAGNDLRKRKSSKAKKEITKAKMYLTLNSSDFADESIIAFTFSNSVTICLSIFVLKKGKNDFFVCVAFMVAFLAL